MTIVSGRQLRLHMIVHGSSGNANTKQICERWEISATVRYRFWRFSVSFRYLLKRPV